jgi:hypothetical protein
VNGSLLHYRKRHAGIEGGGDERMAEAVGRDVLVEARGSLRRGARAD